MAVFPPQFIDHIRSRLTLSELVGRRVRLVRAGREYKGNCPFHNEKSPSFTVNDQKGFFHCFGCGAHGDGIGFLMRADNISFPEAVERLAGEVGLDIPKPTPEARAQYERQASVYDVIEQTTLFFTEQLHGAMGARARDYLERRGLDADIITQFRLGYMPADGQKLIAFLKTRGFDDGLMIDAGVARRSDDGRLYSFFRDRLMFPITDARGRPIAFGGRTLNSGSDEAKYINSADHALFHKGQMVFNYSRARSLVNATGAGAAPLLVVEGYMDVIACHRAGLASVAPLGTALTEQQIQLMWKALPSDSGDKSPIVCFDGDNAGQRAAVRALARVLPILQPNCSLRFAFLPAGEDPDSLIKNKGLGDFKAVMDSALPLSDFLWRSVATVHPPTPEGRAGLKQALLRHVSTIADTTIQTLYRNALLERFDREFHAPKPIYHAQKFQRAGFKAPPVPLTPVIDRRLNTLLALLLLRPDVLDQYGEDIAAIAFPSLAQYTLAGAIMDAHAHNPDITADALHSLLSGQFSGVMASLLAPSAVLGAGLGNLASDPQKAPALMAELLHGLGKARNTSFLGVPGAANTEQNDSFGQKSAENA